MEEKKTDQEGGDKNTEKNNQATEQKVQDNNKQENKEEVKNQQEDENIKSAQIQEQYFKLFQNYIDQSLMREISKIQQNQDFIAQQSQQQYDELYKFATDLKEDNLKSKLQQTQPVLQKQDSQDENSNPDEPYIQGSEELRRLKKLKQFIQIPKNIEQIEQQFDFKMPELDSKQLSNRDIMFLLNQGVNGIFDQTEEEIKYQFLNEKDLKIEFKDRLKSAIIQIHVKAFKPKLEKQILTQEELNKDSGADYLPQRFYFTMLFFDYPLRDTQNELQSGIVTYLERGNLQQINQIIESKNSLKLLRDVFLSTKKLTDKDAKYQYDIDTSISKYQHRHKDFIYYLFSKSMHFEIWDADNQMQYGTIKIPLKELLRRGKKQVKIDKWLDVIDPNNDCIKGQFNIEIIHEGKASEISQEGDQNPNFQPNQPNMGDAFRKKCIVSTNPVKLPQNMIINDTKEVMDEIMKDPQKRKEEKIRRFKNQQLQNIEGQKEMQLLDKELQEKEQIRRSNMAQIMLYKEQKKASFINNVISQYLNDEKLVQIKVGKTEIFIHEYQNKTDVKQKFLVLINDPDQEFLNQREFTLVQNPNEWKFWVDKLKQPKPGNSFELIKDNTFSLDTGASVVLIFKYLTYRQIDYTKINEENAEELAKNENEQYRQRYVNSRKILVTFQGDNKFREQLKIKIQPQSSVTDLYFRFNEKVSRQINLVLPLLYNKTLPPKERPVLEITGQSAIAEWQNDREISIKMKTPEVMTQEKFNIFTYSDIYKSELIQNWRLEINSFAGLDIQVAFGKREQHRLILSGDFQKQTFKLYSSMPQVLSFVSPHDQPFQPVSSADGKPKHTLIMMNICSFSDTPLKIQVNCVNFSTTQIVNSWIIRVMTKEPNIQNVYELNCEVNKEAIQRFYYQNRDKEFRFFSFKTSNKDLLQIIENMLPIEGGQSQAIRFRLPAKPEPGQAQVYVFVQDQEDDKVFECILFKLTYTYGKA